MNLMHKFIIICCLMVTQLSLSAQSVNVNGNRNFTAAVDMSTATSMKFRQGTVLPATCTTGESFLLTAYIPPVDKMCVAPNIWISPLASATYNGIPLLSPVFNDPIIIPNTVVGHNDLYTAPVCTTNPCRRTIVSLSFGGPGVGVGTTFDVYNELKRGGKYYYAGYGQSGGSNTCAQATTCGIGGTGVNVATFILEPGDTAALYFISITGAGPINAIVNSLSFSSDTPLRQVSILSPQSATGLAIYTPPAGKTGIIMDGTGLLPARGRAAITISAAPDTPAGGGWELHLAPTGTALSDSNVISSLVANGGFLQSSQSLLSGIEFIKPGWTLSLQTPLGSNRATGFNSATTGAPLTMLWFWVYEF